MATIGDERVSLLLGTYGQKTCSLLIYLFSDDHIDKAVDMPEFVAVKLDRQHFAAGLSRREQHFGLGVLAWRHWTLQSEG